MADKKKAATADKAEPTAKNGTTTTAATKTAPAKKAKRLEYRSGEDSNGTSYFNSQHNQKVAMERTAAFRATLNDDQNAQLTALLKGMRDGVGWTAAGRILFKGSPER